MTRRLAARFPLVALTACLLSGIACQDDGEPLVGHQGVCETTQGPLLGCPPPTAHPMPPTIEEACQKLVDCGVIALNHEDAEGNHRDDYVACTNRLRGDDFPADRLELTLRCIEVSTCLDLRGGLDGPCFEVGR